MTDERILKLISDLERLRDGHRLESAYFGASQMPHMYAQQKIMHDSKAAAYDFVIRKLQRTFLIINNGKETNT